MFIYFVLCWFYSSPSNLKLESSGYGISGKLVPDFLDENPGRGNKSVNFFFLLGMYQTLIGPDSRISRRIEDARISGTPPRFICKRNLPPALLYLPPLCTYSPPSILLLLHSCYI